MYFGILLNFRQVESFFLRLNCVVMYSCNSLIIPGCKILSYVCIFSLKPQTKKSTFVFTRLFLLSAIRNCATVSYRKHLLNTKEKNHLVYSLKCIKIWSCNLCTYINFLCINWNCVFWLWWCLNLCRKRKCLYPNTDIS